VSAALAVSGLVKRYGAIEALGAKKDGVLRHHAARRDGTARDSVMYSILASEWRDVKRHLELRLARDPIRATCDPERVAQVLRILIDNALRHLSPVGRAEAATAARETAGAFYDCLNLADGRLAFLIGAGGREGWINVGVP